MGNLIQNDEVFLNKYGVDAECKLSIHHRHRIAPKHLYDNRINASEIFFYTFYRKEFKIELDKLNSII